MRWSDKFVLCAACLGILGLAGTAAAQERMTLSLKETLKLAESRNPDLRVSEKQMEEARFSYRAARAIPSLSMSGNYITGNNAFISNNGQTQDVFLAFSQPFGPIGSVALSGKSAFLGYRIARTNLDETRLSVFRSVKDGYYGLLAAREQMQIAEENLKLANELYGLVNKKFDAGAAPKTDLVNAQIQKAALEQGVIQARAARKQAEAALASLLALPKNQSVDPAGSMDFPRLAFNLNSIVEKALRDRPLALSSQLTLDQAEAQIGLAKAQRNPAPSLFYSYDLTVTPLWSFGTSLQFPIFDYGQIRNQVKVEESTLREKVIAREGTLTAILSSVRSAFAAYEASLENASTYKEKVVDPSEALMKMTRYGYREGALPYFQVVAAEQNLRNAQTQYISILLAGHQALDALDAAVGESLEGEPR